MNLDPIKPYLHAIAIAALLGAIGYIEYRVWQAGADHNELEHVRLDAKDKVIHDQELETSNHSHDGELGALGAYVASRPTDAVRRCVPVVAPVQTTGSTGPAAGSAPVGVQPVPTADPGRNNGPAVAEGPDLRGVLTYYGAGADVVSASLRRQESVK